MPQVTILYTLLGNIVDLFLMSLDLVHIRMLNYMSRKFICPAERNMLREMYNFDRHAARV